MRIKWNNIVFMVLIVLGIYVLAKALPVFREASAHLEALHEDGDPIVGFMVFGLICLTVVAIVKIICSKR